MSSSSSASSPSGCLLRAVISQCPDRLDQVLDSLCWTGSTWPQVERVESLTAALGQVLNPPVGSDQLMPREVLISRTQSVIWDQCLPVLRRISSGNGHFQEEGTPAEPGSEPEPGPEAGGSPDSSKKELLHAVCGLLAVCLSVQTSDCLLEKVASLALPAFTTPDHQNQLDIDTSIEVLAVLLSVIITSDSCSAPLAVKILSSTLSGVKHLAEAQASRIIVRLWFTALKSGSSTVLLQKLWTDLLGWFQHHGKNGADAEDAQSGADAEDANDKDARSGADAEDADAAGVTSRVLLGLTALSDHLFFTTEQTALMKHQQGVGLQPDPWQCRAFFRVVQAGLRHRDGVSRRRALFLLKRCVSMCEELKGEVGLGDPESLFRWAPERSLELREFWEDYALVLETLEENQIHVVRPVLNRINRLVETTAAGVDGRVLVDPSWLMCVYQRMFHSENKAVMKEGVNHLLELKILQRPDFASAFSQFVVGPFMEVLAESPLYHRSPGQVVGECPEVAMKLQKFMVMFFSSLPEKDRGCVLLKLLQRLGFQHWCSVPLLFLSQALSHLPPAPLLRADGLNALRDVLRCTMITHQVLLRGATQCFLLHSALCLIHVSAVSLDEVLGFLANFRAEESLSRGTALWRELCDWLLANEGRFRLADDSEGAVPETITSHCSSRLKAFLTVPAGSDQTDAVPDPGEAEALARSLLLSVDLEWIRRPGQNPEDIGLEKLFCPLLDVLRRISTSVYLPLRKTDNSLQLLLHLLQLLNTHSETRTEGVDKVAEALRSLLLGVVEPVQEFILRRLSGELQELCDVDRAGLYLSVFLELVQTYSSAPGFLSNLQNNYVSKLTANCTSILTTPSEQTPSVAGQVQKAVSMATLASLCELGQRGVFELQSGATTSLRSLTGFFCPPSSSSSSSSSSSVQSFNQPLLKPCTADPSARGPDESPVLKDWGRVAARFIRDQWACLLYLRAEAGGSFRAAVEAVALLPSDLVLPVLDFLSSTFPQQVALCDEAVCVEAVCVCWKLVQALSTNAHDFWPALQAFIRLAFNHTALQLTPTQTPHLTTCIKQITCELMELSEAKSGVFNVLIQHCCETWLPSDPNSRTDSAFQSAFNHLDLLTEACVYGPVFRRDQRLVQEVQTYVEQLGEECVANTVISSENRDDQFPRLCVLAFLSHLDPSNSLHHKLMEELVQRLLKKDAAITKSKVRYYSNSMHHRVKNRVWQTLLLLLPKLSPEFVVQSVLVPVCEAGFSSNQASVKYLIEWALILILHQNPAHIQKLWDCFSTDQEQEKTKTSICTFLSVLVHLHILLPKLEDKVAQWQRAIEVALLWCFSHNFSVRLYALLALKRVWQMEGVRALAQSQQGGQGSLGGLGTVVQACLRQAETMQNSGNAMKNWTKIQEHFFFSAFHPLNDYSLETILHTFPSLSELADDEWVPVWKLEKLVDFHASVPVRNAGRELSELQPGDWIQQDRGELEQEERWADVQKKIAPWRLSVQEQEPQLMAQQRAVRLGKLTNALVVVASLIDKPTNLGGLCRTCEIFGASALVLDSLRHVSDKQFQALSVSSELWLPLLEVKPAELTDFLQLKKREGYCIVGVEQTANSQSLQDYRFPEKTLLLLGNEREGIDVNLLQLLDVCVEIPQQGVTRSLNVHVSAALLVWEYTRQRLGSAQEP